MSIVWKILDTLSDLDSLAPSWQLSHRNSGNRLTRRTRNMKDVDKSGNLQKANDLIGGVNERKQALSPHELSGTCKQKRQTRRVDKAHSLAIDDNATHAPVDQIIQPSAQHGHRGDVDITRWRQNRYVIPLIHTTMVPQKSSLDAYVSPTVRIQPAQRRL